MEIAMIPEKRKSVDLLVEEFWRKGYLTIRRRFGTYLPEPNEIGGFEVDIVARQKKEYAIGIALSPDDLNSPEIMSRINYLATRQSRFTSKRVKLFIGVPLENISAARERIKTLSPEVSANVRIVPIAERKKEILSARERRGLFS
jgi:hypothetical protein